MSEQDTYRELMEAYALGTLDAAEKAQVEAHLTAGCAECVKALDEARWLVSQLAYLAPEASPSDALKGRLLQTVRREAIAPAERQRSAVPAWVWAGVAALVVLTFYSSWEARRTKVQMAEVTRQAQEELQKREALQEQLLLARRERAILTNPASVKIAMWGENKAEPKMQAMWHARMGIIVAGENVPPPPGDWTLELWLLPKQAGAKPMRAGTLRPDAKGNFFLVVENPPDTIEATKGLAITAEPAGGSEQPTTRPLWTGTIG